MNKTKHTLAEYRDLVAKSLSSSPETAKAAIKEISSTKYKVGDLQRKVIFEYLPPDPAIVADTSRYENFLKLLALACWSKNAEEYKDELLSEAWRGLEHPNGTVRQAARRLMDTVCTITHDTHESPSKSADKYIELLDQIEQKLKEHKPLNPPTSIEKAPPSIYKTLTLLWYDIAFIPIVAPRIDSTARMVEIEIMPYDEPVPDDEVAIDYYSLSDWQDNLEEYVHCKDQSAAHKPLKLREKQALVYLDWALADLGLSDLRAKIMYHATYGEQEKLAALLEDKLTPVLLGARSQDEGYLLVFRYNKLARAIQYLDNNIVHTSRQGTPFSREVVEAVYCANENVKYEKVRLDEYAASFEAAHRAIDDFVHACIKPAIKQQNARYRKLEKVIGSAFEPSPIDLMEPAQIAHYLLDKLPTTSYKTFLSQEARKIAGTIWKIFADDNLWLLIPGLDTATLGAFGGWKSESGVNSSVLTYRMNIAETVSDPSIMYIVRNADDLQQLKEMQQIQRRGFGPVEF